MLSNAWFYFCMFWSSLHSKVWLHTDLDLFHERLEIDVACDIRYAITSFPLQMCFSPSISQGISMEMNGLL